MAVKVIAGRAHGRRLRVPGGGGTRPTSGLVRGALFNMLAHRGWLDDARILDCFAGSGALGIEALSRGARSAIFVESVPAAARVLRSNVVASGLAERSRVMTMPMTRAVRALGREGVVVDGVLADPPYGEHLVQQLLDEIERAGVLAEDGWIAVEHAADEPPVPGPGLALVASRRHGRTTLSLLARATEDA
ncbi:MAG: 16S rRNA (guanine(966)-N(2))-methyltransferase RsmD [bacterium]|nr:16S rRNA (guanine(966)-N(2))-methyltransferase RsmD [bacterium]